MRGSPYILFSVHLGCHGGNLGGGDGARHDVVSETGILEISEIRHPAPNPLLVLVPRVPELLEHTWTPVKDRLLEITDSILNTGVDYCSILEITDSITDDSKTLCQ
jgi:hypothetical protein